MSLRATYNQVEKRKPKNVKTTLTERQIKRKHLCRLCQYRCYASNLLTDADKAAITKEVKEKKPHEPFYCCDRISKAEVSNLIPDTLNTVIDTRDTEDGCLCPFFRPIDEKAAREFAKSRFGRSGGRNYIRDCKVTV